MNRSRSHLARAGRRRPAVESLEGRALMAAFTVTNDSDAGAGSLRAAILGANAAADASTITFDIPGAGVHTIAPLVDLPTLVRPMTIDATTQPGYAGPPLIALDGAPHGGSSGLFLNTGGGQVDIVGLAIRGFGYAAIDVANTPATIRSNVLGGSTDAPGGARSVAGVVASTSAGLGPIVISANVIGGNFDGIEAYGGGPIEIRGNFIGTDASGRADLGNARDGVSVGGDATTVTIADNTIAHNARFAIDTSQATGLPIESGNTLFANGLGSANLSVRSTSAATSAVTGQTLTATYTVTNNGPASATNVFVGVGSQNSQPDFLDGFYSPSTVFKFLGAVVSQGSVTDSPNLTLESAELGTLAPGASATITVAFRVVGSGSDVLLVKASSRAPTTDATAAINSTPVVATGRADLAVVALPAPRAQVGRPETFTFVVTNRDPSFSADARVVVTFGATPAYAPQGVVVSQGAIVSLASGTGIGGVGSVPQPLFPNTFGGDLGTLGPGQSAVISATLVPPALGAISATAYAYSTADADPTPTNNLAAAAVVARDYPTLLGATAEPPTGFYSLVAVYIDGDVNIASAQNPRNYAVIANGKRVAVRSATYDRAPYFGATHVVTLRLAGAIDRAAIPPARITIAGPGTPGIKGPSGTPLISAGATLNLT